MRYILFFFNFLRKMFRKNYFIFFNVSISKVKKMREREKEFYLNKFLFCFIV
jgi:hypothetical protein